MDNIKIQYEYSKPTVIDWCTPIVKKAKAKPIMMKFGFFSPALELLSTFCFFFELMRLIYGIHLTFLYRPINFAPFIFTEV